MDHMIKAGDRLCHAALEALHILEQQRLRDMHAQAVMASLRHATTGWWNETKKTANKPTPEANGDNKRPSQ